MKSKIARVPEVNIPCIAHALIRIDAKSIHTCRIAHRRVALRSSVSASVKASHELHRHEPRVAHASVGAGAGALNTRR